MEGGYVWADGSLGVRRYDRARDRWERVTYREKEVHLIALAEGVLWGHVWLDDELRDRPCLIDRETLEVTPILIEESAPGNRMINGPFGYFGTWRGKPVLGPKRPKTGTSICKGLNF